MTHTLTGQAPRGLTGMKPRQKDRAEPPLSQDRLSGDIAGEIFDRTESRRIIVKNILVDGAKKEIFIDP